MLEPADGLFQTPARMVERDEGQHAMPAEAARIGDAPFAPIISMEAVEELGHDRVNPSSFRETLSMIDVCIISV
ncbi:hypothetical protein WJ31_10735 [Burkholderia ubonensis]|nr:hypothetical protein WJ31_10735 [Burkholderia ubonensis]